MANITNNTTNLQAVLEALQNKAAGGGSGGTDTNDATAVAADILKDKTAYVKGVKVTGTIETRTSSNLTANGATVTVPAGYYSTQATKAVTTATQATPAITVGTNGLITATATQTAGYVTAGTKSSTYQMAFQAAQTITPGTTNQTIPANTYLGGAQTIKGDANLVAGNIKKGTSIFGVTGTLDIGKEISLQNKTVTTNGSYTADSGYDGLGIVTVNVVGGDVDHSIEDSFVNKTLQTYYNDRLTMLVSSAFEYFSKLTQVEFPNCSIINYNAFNSCINLTNIDFPKCTTIERFAFAGCSKIQSINFPLCETIDRDAFSACRALTTAIFPACVSVSGAFVYCTSLATISFPVCVSLGSTTFSGCTALSSISFPLCKSVGGACFSGCTNLVSLSFPVCTFIDSRAFSGCTKLQSITFPECLTIGQSAFYTCSSLTNVNFPKCSDIKAHAFDSCSNITTLSFPECTAIGAYAFNNCKKLMSLTLEGSTVVTLGSSMAFYNTPMSLSTLTGSFGSIFVPASLVASYKAATNWVIYADRIVAIGGGSEGEGEGGETESNVFYFATGNELLGTLTYTFTPGQTWAEFINSNADTSFAINSSSLINGGIVGIINEDGEYEGDINGPIREGFFSTTTVYGEDKIVAGFTYTYVNTNDNGDEPSDY